MPQNKKVLVVEDEKPLQRAIEKQLTTSGFDVALAVSVKEAIKQLEKGRVDCIWLDHYLYGDEDGLDFLEKITLSYFNFLI